MFRDSYEVVHRLNCIFVDVFRLVQNSFHKFVCYRRYVVLRRFRIYSTNMLPVIENENRLAWDCIHVFHKRILVCVSDKCRHLESRNPYTVKIDFASMVWRHIPRCCQASTLFATGLESGSCSQDPSLYPICTGGTCIWKFTYSRWVRGASFDHLEAIGGRRGGQHKQLFIY